MTTHFCFNCNQCGKCPGCGGCWCMNINISDTVSSGHIFPTKGPFQGLEDIIFFKISEAIQKEDLEQAREYIDLYEKIKEISNG